MIHNLTTAIAVQLLAVYIPKFQIMQKSPKALTKFTFQLLDYN